MSQEKSSHSQHVCAVANSKGSRKSQYLRRLGGIEKFKPFTKTDFSKSFKVLLEWLKITLSGSMVVPFVDSTPRRNNFLSVFHFGQGFLNFHDQTTFLDELDQGMILTQINSKTGSTIIQKVP